MYCSTTSTTAAGATTTNNRLVKISGVQTYTQTDPCVFNNSLDFFNLLKMSL